MRWPEPLSLSFSAFSNGLCLYRDVILSSAKLADIHFPCIHTTLYPGTSTASHFLFGRASLQEMGQVDR